MEKPILFNTEMVQAILAGRKTQTRRALKNIKAYHHDGTPGNMPPCKPGDVFYVRETYRLLQVNLPDRCAYVKYAADDSVKRIDLFKVSKKRIEDMMRLVDTKSDKWKWRPGIHMPREAARLFLKVKKVRIEHLNDIRLNGCLSEGVQLTTAEQSDLVLAPIRARGRFAQVWDSTLKPVEIDRFGWEANPWVWVIEFEKVERSK